MCYINSQTMTKICFVQNKIKLDTTSVVDSVLMLNSFLSVQILVYFRLLGIFIIQGVFRSYILNPFKTDKSKIPHMS